jgi:SpoVK/Ycf46/Vps4 family AAA+-type ATPase
LTNVSEATRDPGPDPDDDSSNPTADRPTLEEVVGELADLQRDLFLTGTDGWTPTSNHDHAPFDLLTFAEPDVDLRREIWQTYADEFAEDVDLDAIASTFTLTQGQIDDAVETARTLTDDPRDDKLPREALVEGCTSQTAKGLEKLATEIEPDADWDDLVLRSDVERELWEIAARIRYRGPLADKYGYGDRYTRGNGVFTLFAGPSGTGKTLAAEVIASMAGMKIYKINISNVVSKYIGETEENLERLFDAARDSNAILLFDEADAIFGERAGVSDATDRYANVEVNYLLQRIEEYEGVVLLTTNNESHIDSAFTRRIHQTINFPRPQPPEREQIWRIVFPEETETADLDYEFLASFEITGGNIRNIAHTATVLAAADDGVVHMEHVVEALQRELDQLGRICNASEFGEYSQYLHRNEATVYTDWNESDDESESDGSAVGAENGVTPSETTEVTAETNGTGRQGDGATDGDATSLPESTASESGVESEAGTAREPQVNDLRPEDEHPSGVGTGEEETGDAGTNERDTAGTGTDEDEDEEEEILTPDERIAQIGSEANTGGHIDTDARSGSNTRKRDSPEEVVEQFFEHLAAGETEKAEALYHTEGRTLQITDTKRHMLETNTLALSNFRRQIDTEYRVVLYFEQRSDNAIVPLEYELRPQGREWRLFEMKKRGDPSRL